VFWQIFSPKLDRDYVELVPKLLENERMSEVAEIVRLARSMAGFSQERLAHVAGVSKAGIQFIETGRTAKPNLSTLFSIARALGFETWDQVVASVSDSGHPATTSDLDDESKQLTEQLAQEHGVDQQEAVRRALLFLSQQPKEVQRVILLTTHHKKE
jgi:DNA-binding XRE family transcriptional regulator